MTAAFVVARISATVDVPVTADFEGGYTDNDTVLAKSISQLLRASSTAYGRHPGEVLAAALVVEGPRALSFSSLVRFCTQSTCW